MSHSFGLHIAIHRPGWVRARRIGRRSQWLFGWFRNDSTTRRSAFTRSWRLLRSLGSRSIMLMRTMVLGTQGQSPPTVSTSIGKLKYEATQICFQLEVDRRRRYLNRNQNVQRAVKGSKINKFKQVEIYQSVSLDFALFIITLISTIYSETIVFSYTEMST